MIKSLAFFLCLCGFITQAQTLRLPWRITSASSGTVVVPPTGTLAILGPDSVAEGSSGSYRVISTGPGSVTTDVSASATFTASRGSASGLTVSFGSPVVLASATNGIKGDHRITRLTATYNGETAIREIVLKDATVTATQFVPRMVTSADIAKWPQLNMKLGDYLVGGANFVSGDHSIQIRTSQKNAPTLSPGATVWVKGGDYVNIVIQLDSARTTDAQERIRIRNYDGQVKVLNSLQLLGAQGLLASGRYEPGVGGDSDYRGHEGDYMIRADRYGFQLDNRWTDSTKNGLGMDGGCQRVEVEFMEIRGGYFAGVFVNTRNYDMRLTGSTVSLPFRRMKFHDLYIHDMESEGFYLGNTGSGVWGKFDSLEVYNNLVVRTGTEAIQIGQLQRGTHVHNNVAMGNLDEEDPFRNFQDNNLQTEYREGGQLIEKNIFIRGGEKFLNALSQTSDVAGHVTASTDTIMYRRNAWLYNGGTNETYFNSTTGGTPIPNLTIAFVDNWFGRNRFMYDRIYPSKPRESFIMKFDIKGAGNRIVVQNNTFDGSSPVTTWVSNSNPGTATVVQSGNTLTGTVPAPEFENFMGLGNDFDYTKILFWTPKIGQSSLFPAEGSAKGTPVTVPVGEIRMHHGIAYESKAANNTAIEPGRAANWKDYWNILYWNRTTGALVRNPTDLRNLSSIPTDRLLQTTFSGIGVPY